MEIPNIDKIVFYPHVEIDKLKLTSCADPNRLDPQGFINIKENFLKHFKETANDGEETLLRSINVISFSMLRPQGLFLMQSSNMIYPETDNCMDAGWIACNSILSGLHGKGISHCDSLAMNLVMRLNVEGDDREKGIDEIVSGFKRCAEEAEVKVTNGWYISSTYIIIGGVATAICHEKDQMACDAAAVGDVLVLTKPLGLLTALRSNDSRFKSQLVESCNSHIIPKIEEAYKSAIVWMRRSNKAASILMKQHNAHAAIDINGSSFFKCASELAKNQKNSVEFRIYKIPLLQYVDEIDKIYTVHVERGLAEEQCGGLLICLPPESAHSFVNEMSETENHLCFVIGEVTSGGRKVNILDNAQIMPVTLH